MEQETGFFAQMKSGFSEEYAEQIAAEEQREAERIAEDAERQYEEYMRREYDTIYTKDEREVERAYDCLETALRNIKDGSQSYLKVNGDVFRIQYLYTEQRGA